MYFIFQDCQSGYLSTKVCRLPNDTSPSEEVDRKTAVLLKERMLSLTARYLECILAKVPSHCLPEDTSDIQEISALNNISSQVMFSNLAYLKADSARQVALSHIIAWTTVGVGAILALLCKNFSIGAAPLRAVPEIILREEVGGQQTLFCPKDGN